MDACSQLPARPAIKFNFAMALYFAYLSKHKKDKVINVKTARKFHKIFWMHWKEVKITVHETINSEKTTKNHH